MSSRSSGERLIRVGIVCFLATCVLLFVLGWWLGPPDLDSPGYPISEVAQVQADETWLVTLDSSDIEQWRGFSLTLGRPVPQGAAADFYVRRFLLRAPRGAADLGKQPLHTANHNESIDWKTDIIIDGISRNPVLSGWFRYSYLTHLLRSEEHTYAVRLGTGVGFIQVLSYYCQPTDSGCLTIRYRLAEP